MITRSFCRSSQTQFYDLPTQLSLSKAAGVISSFHAIWAINELTGLVLIRRKHDLGWMLRLQCHEFYVPEASPWNRLPWFKEDIILLQQEIKRARDEQYYSKGSAIATTTSNTNTYHSIYQYYLELPGKMMGEYFPTRQEALIAIQAIMLEQPKIQLTNPRLPIIKRWSLSSKESL